MLEAQLKQKASDLEDSLIGNIISIILSLYVGMVGLIQWITIGPSQTPMGVNILIGTIESIFVISILLLVLKIVRICRLNKKIKNVKALYKKYINVFNMDEVEELIKMKYE